jgi:phage baseplate assembly protein W
MYTSFLGTGWSFPPQFVKEEGVARNGEVVMTSDEEDIRASLHILFGTAEGERFLNPKYGLRMDDQVFEPMGTTARTYLKDRVRTAILIYEPRINLVALELDTSRDNEGVIAIVMDYVVRTTNSRFNLVYPFYRHDANEVRGRTPVRTARAAPAA